jgi:phage-related protein
MRLVRIGKLRWEVLAVCDHRGSCPVTDFLVDLAGTTDQIAAEQMLRLLRMQVPVSGPPKAEPLCKPLGGGLYEFRKQPKGKKLRVVWFYGGGAVIICAAAFTKAERTPKTEIESARALQKAYLEDKRDAKLEIIDL